eukprot:3946926-Pleurochrysis_carterae.AAC.1
MTATGRDKLAAVSTYDTDSLAAHSVVGMYNSTSPVTSDTRLRPTNLGRDQVGGGGGGRARAGPDAPAERQLGLARAPERDEAQGPHDGGQCVKRHCWVVVDRNAGRTARPRGQADEGKHAERVDIEALPSKVVCNLLAPVGAQRVEWDEWAEGRRTRAAKVGDYQPPRARALGREMQRRDIMH